MKYALLYNVFVCWLVAGMGLTAARHILSLEKLKPEDRAFGYFWLFSGCLWSFSGLRLLSFQVGYPTADLAFFYVVQIFLAIHIIAILFFLTGKSFESIRLRGIVIVVGGISLAMFVFFVFKDGVVHTIVTDWATDHEISKRAFFSFLPAYLLCLGLTAYAIGVTLWKSAKAKKFDSSTFSALLALVIYEIAGIIDVKGSTADYRLALIRACYMVSALISFLSFSWDSSSVQLIRIQDEDDELL